MPKIDHYMDLVIWKKAFELCLLAIDLSRKTDFEREYWITDQLRKSAVSIPSNIAEGFGRRTRGDFIHFLRYASGSLFELHTQCLICKRLEYISSDEFEEFDAKVIELSKMLTAFIMYLQKRNREWSTTTPPSKSKTIKTNRTN